MPSFPGSRGSAGCIALLCGDQYYETSRQLPLKAEHGSRTGTSQPAARLLIQPGSLTFVMSLLAKVVYVSCFNTFPLSLNPVLRFFLSSLVCVQLASSRL